ncbi:hypothetical protein [Roseomonas sp. 18066]|uniref:hypothetical protein n=1 Tax=Roseomonas sp. 18066 TaxID=2681412 RepID=UPI00135A5110|nr:hypothetical protein [Roseomonas sp. 18066]
MSTSELQRLTTDLARDVALRARLAPALAPGAPPVEAAALLQSAGYRIGPEHLRQAEAELDDDTLDRVSGGQTNTRKPTSPFD